MKQFKNLLENFIWLPAEMKLFFIGIVFLILFVANIGLVRCKSKPSQLEKANIQFKIDSANASKTELTIKQIKNRISGPDNGLFSDSVLISNGIKVR